MSRIVVVGTGPAALVAATQLARAGHPPVIFERRAAPGWKLLVAGSSGLNVAWDCPESELASHYPVRGEELSACFREFGVRQWLEMLESLGQEIFLGTSRRWFLREMTAASLLQAWMKYLQSLGVEFHFQETLTMIVREASGLRIRFDTNREVGAPAVILALGGASWEPKLPEWTSILEKLGIEISPFAPANAGWHIKAAEAFFQAAEGKPIKGVTLSTKRGTRTGELMITRYGLEGTPVYTLGCPGIALLDLKPDLTEDRLLERLRGCRGTVWNRIERGARLSPGALMLLKHLSPTESLGTIESAASLLKRFPLELTESRPLSESISSRGGVSWDSLNGNLEAKATPGLFFAGEMIDWDAPTGGFLLTACASTGAKAAQGALKVLRES